jgi:hypothetical protein
MYDKRTPEVRLEVFGGMFREHIDQMTRGFAEVKASLTSQSLEPKMLEQIRDLSTEVRNGTASARPTAVDDKPFVVDSSQLHEDFPGFRAGPVVDANSIAEVVLQYRSLGLSAVGCNSSGTGRIYYDPAQTEGEFSFEL